MRLLRRQRWGAGTRALPATTLLFRNAVRSRVCTLFSPDDRGGRAQLHDVQAEAIKGQLEEIESRMHDLEADK